MPNMTNGQLHPRSAYQLWISRAQGEVHITEVEPGYWREYVFYEGYNGRGRWFQRNSLAMGLRPCDAASLHPRLKEACRHALTW